MVTLLIDVVSNNSIIALIPEKKPKKIEKMSLEYSRSHSENIVPALETLIENSIFSYTDIKKVVCVTGPGNYTNIRTGLAVAKSISLVNQIHAYGLTQHDLIMQTYEYSTNSCDLIVITPSINNNFYYQEFNGNIPKQSEPIMLSANAVLNNIDLNKSNIVETGKEFQNYLIKKNINVNNLRSNYIIQDNNLVKITELKSIVPNNVDAKYIKTPNFVKYTKKDIYE